MTLNLRSTTRILIIFASLLALALFFVGRAHSQDATVYAVLFYSPSCPHCHDVMDNDLPPLLEQYGDQLQILAVDTTQQSGQSLFQAMVEQFNLPRNRMGVPALIVGQTHLVGSVEIPEQLPGIVDAALGNGGLDLPNLPGLAWPTVPTYGVFLAVADDALVAAEAPTGPSGEAIAATTAGTPVVADAPAAGSDGILLASLVLAGMVAVLAYGVYRLVVNRPNWGALPAIQSLGVPVLVVLGLIVAAYLAYVEITHVEAVCGPVGECNIVQGSSYATLAGVPVAVLGLLSYAAIGVLWLVQRVRSGLAADWSRGALLAVTLGGLLFSIYLTVVEIFVIDAVCVWCLSSAVITTALFLFVVLALTPVVAASRRRTRPGGAYR